MEARTSTRTAARPQPLATDLLLDPAFPYGEDLLQFIWEAGLYEGDGLRTTDGAPLEVLHAGRIQLHSGPDLRDARVRISGQEWAGNVEVHLRSSDWNAHGHQHDAAYNNVVLHTVYRHDAEVRTADGRSPATVELRGRINPANLRLHQELMESRTPVPCASRLAEVDQGRLRMWLERLQVERLERKTAGVEALYRQTGHDPAEVLHHLLLRALGNPVNAEPFAMLAHALPLKLLLKYRDDRIRVEALLFGQAGFLGGENLAEEHPARLQQEYRWLAALHGLRPVPTAAWKFGRLRPPGFPTVRLAQWAALLHGLPGGYAQLLEHDDPAAVRALLQAEAHGPYWAEHYRFGVHSRPQPKRLGASTADSLILNALVPYLFAMGRIRGHQPWMDRALALQEGLPAERNSVTRLWEGLGVRAGNAGHSQALIELKDRWCAEKRCLECAVGVRLHSGIKRVVDGA